MLRFKQFIQLLETLTDTQKSWVDKNSFKHTTHDPLFNNPPENATKIDNDTFTIPLPDNYNISPIDKTTENHISSLLEPHGFKIHDYTQNIAIDNHGRSISITKALSKIKQNPNLYARDPRIINKNAGIISPETHEIVISRNPYHIAGMSSGRNFNTCMTLPNDPRDQNGGSEYNRLSADLLHDTLIAYLTPKNSVKPNQELNKDQVISRILLKKYIHENDHIFRPDINSYSGSDNLKQDNEKNIYPEFNDVIREFSRNAWKPKYLNDTYSLHNDLYPEDSISTIHTIPDDQIDEYKLNLADDLQHNLNIHDIKTAIINGYWDKSIHIPIAQNTLENQILNNQKYDINLAKEFGYYNPIIHGNALNNILLQKFKNNTITTKDIDFAQKNLFWNHPIHSIIAQDWLNHKISNTDIAELIPILSHASKNKYITPNHITQIHNKIKSQLESGNFNSSFITLLKNQKSKNKKLILWDPKIHIPAASQGLLKILHNDPNLYHIHDAIYHNYYIPQLHNPSFSNILTNILNSTPYYQIHPDIIQLAKDHQFFTPVHQNIINQ